MRMRPGEEEEKAEKKMERRRGRGEKRGVRELAEKKFLGSVVGQVGFRQWTTRQPRNPRPSVGLV